MPAAADAIADHRLEEVKEAGVDTVVTACATCKRRLTRNGVTAIRLHIRIAGDAPAEKLRTVVARGTDRSVVFDSIANGVPISVDVDTV